MVIQYVAQKCTPADLSANLIQTAGGVERQVSMQCADGVDFFTLVWHNTQSAGTTKGSFQGALSTDGPWIDLFAVSTIAASESGYKQVPKFPLLRFLFESTGTDMVFTAAAIA